MTTTYTWDIPGHLLYNLGEGRTSHNQRAEALTVAEQGEEGNVLLTVKRLEVANIFCFGSYYHIQKCIKSARLL